MIPLLRRIIHDFLLDEDRAVLWLRTAMMAIGAGGVAFANDLAGLIDAPGHIKAIKVASTVCAFISVGIGKGDRTPEDVKSLAIKARLQQ